MSQLSEMRSRIATDLADNTLSSDIDKAINRAIDFYESEDLWFKDTTASFTCVASQAEYTSSDGIPTDIAEIEYVEVTINGNDQEVRPMTHAEFQRRDTGNIQGQPRRYAFYNDSFFLYPAPDSTYVVTVYYKKTYTELSSDTDTNDWTTDAEDLIEAHAEWWIYTRVKKDFEKAGIAAQEVSVQLQALRKKNSKKKATGRITKHE